MNVYAVMMDDYEAGWPEAIFTTKKFAVDHADKLNNENRDYEVVEYTLNHTDNGNSDQVVYNTSERWKTNH